MKRSRGSRKHNQIRWVAHHQPRARHDCPAPPPAQPVKQSTDPPHGRPTALRCLVPAALLLALLLAALLHRDPPAFGALHSSPLALHPSRRDAQAPRSISLESVAPGALDSSHHDSPPCSPSSIPSPRRRPATTACCPTACHLPDASLDYAALRYALLPVRLCAASGRPRPVDWPRSDSVLLHSVCPSGHPRTS